MLEESQEAVHEDKVRLENLVQNQISVSKGKEDSWGHSEGAQSNNRYEKLNSVGYLDTS